jgi:hypothetical protein
MSATYEVQVTFLVTKPPKTVMGDDRYTADEAVGRVAEQFRTREWVRQTEDNGIEIPGLSLGRPPFVVEEVES